MQFGLREARIELCEAQTVAPRGGEPYGPATTRNLPQTDAVDARQARRTSALLSHVIRPVAVDCRLGCAEIRSSDSLEPAD